MKTLGALVGAAVLAAMAFSGVASAQNLGEDKAWQFQTPPEKVVHQNDVVLIQQKQNDVYKAYKNGGAGAFGGTAGPGLFGSSTSATNNQTYIFNQTTNNCTNTGGTLSCGSGNVSGTVSQTTSDSTNTANSTNTGNTVTAPINTNSGNSGSTTITGN
jgi:hypothetical protein